MRHAAARLDAIAAAPPAPAPPSPSAPPPPAAAAGGLPALTYLIGGLGALLAGPLGPSSPLARHVPRVCSAVEAATLAHAGGMDASLLSACLHLFVHAGHAPGGAWGAMAGGVVARSVEAADGHDLAALMAACNA